MSEHEDRREANKAERIALRLHPKMGSQSLAETRRILMTWTKADLIEFYIREESDMLKAVDRAIDAEQALREHRAEALTLSKPRRSTPHPEADLAYETWSHPLKGQMLDPRTIFDGGWEAALTPTSTGEAKGEDDNG